MYIEPWAILIAGLIFWGLYKLAASTFDSTGNIYIGTKRERAKWEKERVEREKERAERLKLAEDQARNS